MKQKASVCSAISAVEQPNSPKVLISFEVGNYQCLIISLELSSRTQFCADTLSSCLSDYVELSRFEVEGHFFAIVQKKSVEKFETSVDIDLTAILTERELQIAVLVASGQGNKQIANQLCISEWTVSTHLRRIFIKLGVDSRAAMVFKCASIIHNSAFWQSVQSIASVATQPPKRASKPTKAASR